MSSDYQRYFSIQPWELQPKSSYAPVTIKVGTSSGGYELLPSPQQQQAQQPQNEQAFIGAMQQRIQQAMDGFYRRAATFDLDDQPKLEAPPKPESLEQTFGRVHDLHPLHYACRRCGKGGQEIFEQKLMVCELAGQPSPNAKAQSTSCNCNARPGGQTNRHAKWCPQSKR